MFEKKCILGVDPGLTRCGTGAVNGTVRQPPVFVAVGVVCTSPDLDAAHWLLQVEVGLKRWFTEHTPDVVATERVLAQHNTVSVVDTAQAAGVVAPVAAQHGLPATFHAPDEVKAAVTGLGWTGKPQATSIVIMVLRLDVPPKPAGVADAPALAICHAWRDGHTDRYIALVAAARGKR